MPIQSEIDRLTEIVVEMRTLLSEAQDILRNEASDFLYERAKAYPIAHIDAALDHEGWTMNTYDITLQDIVDDLQEQIEEEEEEENPDDPAANPCYNPNEAVHL
jgi:hypothetical protein